MLVVFVVLSNVLLLLPLSVALSGYNKVSNRPSDGFFVLQAAFAWPQLLSKT